MTQLTLQQAFDMAVRHHQAGHLPEAEELYRQVLSLHPDHIDALHLSGVLAHQSGRNDQAISLIRRAIALRPNFPEAHSNLGIVLAASNQLDEAIAAYRKTIALSPHFPGVHLNLGIALEKKGDIDEAIAIYRQAILDKPGYAEAHNNLGNALKEKNQLDDAIAEYRQAIALNPRLLQAQNNLGSALAAKDQFDEAIAIFHKVIQLSPKYAEAFTNLGHALRCQGRLDDAIAACRTAISLKPNLPEAFNNLGIALKDNGQTAQAISNFEQSIQLRPDYAEAHYNLATALKLKQRLDEAMAANDRAIALQPQYAKAHALQGNILKDMGELDAAIAAYRKAIELDPADADMASNLLFALHYHPACDATTIAKEHLDWNAQHAEPLRKFIAPHSNSRTRDRRLKLAYVSPDFRAHPVGRFLLPLLQHHDHHQFEVICYFNSSMTDAMTARLRPHADHWLPIPGLTDEQLAQRIRADEIDLLIDLSGHTADNRLLVFARKPAPVQISYLGYPNTTGLATIDYCLTDPWADPVGSAGGAHPETRFRLPHTNWCFDEPENSPPVEPSPATRHGHVTFGSFNNLAKATPTAFQLWAKILSQLPDSRLLLKSFALSSQRVKDRIYKDFAAHGITPNQLAFTGFDRSYASHLAAYNQLDIALDTFPYHGTTTTCDALWMGVPVVTLAGQTHVSRVGVSLLTNVGLPDLIATTENQYIQIAVDLAKDINRLAHLRQTMRDRMRTSPLMNAQTFTHDIESAYHQMWQQWCKAPDLSPPIPAPGTPEEG